MFRMLLSFPFGLLLFAPPVPRGPARGRAPPHGPARPASGTLHCSAATPHLSTYLMWFCGFHGFFGCREACVCEILVAVPSGSLRLPLPVALRPSAVSSTDRGFTPACTRPTAKWKSSTS